MTKAEAIQVFKKYLKTGIVPNPYELQEASKLAIAAIPLLENDLFDE